MLQIWTAETVHPLKLVPDSLSRRAYVLIRPRRSLSAAAFSSQTFSWTICRSVGPYVRASVALSSALWKNGGSDPDAVWQWHHRSDGSRDEAGSGVWGSVHGKGTYGGEFGRAIVTNGDFTAYLCVTEWCQKWAANTL